MIWRDIPVREYLAAYTGLPTQLDSHTRALMHAEQLYGRMGVMASSVVLFVGNVIDVSIAATALFAVSCTTVERAAVTSRSSRPKINWRQIN
ncbi:hypothetical protein AB0M45_16345 [Nocardia sp. NPDC051787]|uniref:hypothetical protein n=1 Tax=Nocardia sp. NPDC051787 TaxID=3155415 RepID=UPI00341D3FE0